MYSLSPKQRPELSRYLKQMPLQQAAEHPAKVFHDNRKEIDNHHSLMHYVMKL